jgi:hypothetical protein
MKTLTISLCSLFVVCVTLFGCDSGEGFRNYCNVTDPLKQLGWLKDTVAEIEANDEDIIIKSGDYNGEKVYTFHYCCLACRLDNLYAQAQMFNCLGTQIKNPELDQYKNIETIYRKEDSACL